LGKPDFKKAIEQHSAYCHALRGCGLELIVLEADDRYPDGCFVEDTAIVTGEVAVITRPGAASRMGEEAEISDQEESYSANCLPVNDFLLIPKGFPKSKKKILELGYNIIELDMSEFRKMDGGLTCLSLLF
jgi:dimethylargininase